MATNKYNIEEIKKEIGGFLGTKSRVTSRDTEGKVAVSDWKDSEHEATKQARERLSEPRKKN